MTIQLIAKEVDYQKIGRVTEDNLTGYYTVPGRTTRWSDVGGHLLDGMLRAQTNLGQVSWTDLSQTIAKGTVYNHEHGGNDRVLVVDGDNADANDVIDAMLWLSNQHD